MFFTTISNSKIGYAQQGVTVDDIREFQDIKLTEHIIQRLTSPYYKGRDIRSNTVYRTQTFIENIIKFYGINAYSSQYSIPYKLDDTIEGKNIVGIYRGNERKKTAVLLMANYDNLGIKTNQGQEKMFPGANDNASGVAALINTMIFLRNISPDENIVFAFTSGKFNNSIGVGSLVELIKKQGGLKIKYAINIDKIGKSMPGSGVNLICMEETTSTISNIANEYLGDGFMKLDTSNEFGVESDHRAISNVLKIPSATWTSFNYSNDDNYMTEYDDQKNIDINYLHRTSARITFAIYKIIKDKRQINFGNIIEAKQEKKEEE